MLRDVMESAGLTIYAEIALVILFAAFAFTVVRTLVRKRGHYDELANLPLADDDEVGRREDAGQSSTKPSEV
jgi:cbb3-type cytochrome oxidase subunit 3